MTPGSEPYVRLRHGTTRQRAEAILVNGPDPNFREPGSPIRAEGFSTARLQGPYLFGSPEEVAVRKARLFPNEGGPAVLEIEVPESLALKAELWGEVRFDFGYGLEELLQAWSSLPRRILVP
jgi:hypothetical protein